MLQQYTGVCGGWNGTLEQVAERTHVRFEQRRVIGPVERQPLRDCAALRERAFHRREEVRGADRDALVRAVVHRHHHRAARDGRGDFVHRFFARADREQRHVRPAGRGLLALHHLHDFHEPAAEHLVRVHRAAREQRAEFARAVPGYRGNRNPEVREQAVDGLVREQHAEDGRPEAAQLCFGRGALGLTRTGRQVQHAAQRRFGLAGLGREPVAPRERVFDFGERGAQVCEHVQVLRALTREQQRDRALCAERFGEVVDAVGVADLLGLRVREALRGASQLRAQVGFGRGHDREPHPGVLLGSVQRAEVR